MSNNLWILFYFLGEIFQTEKAYNFHQYIIAMKTVSLNIRLVTERQCLSSKFQRKILKFFKIIYLEIANKVG